MTEWTEGVCGDGAAILRDGQMVPISELLAHLNIAKAVKGTHELEVRPLKRRVVELETALTNLMQKSVDHIIAGHPINSDALAALHEAERVLTNH